MERNFGPSYCEVKKMKGFEKLGFCANTVTVVSIVFLSSQLISLFSYTINFIECTNVEKLFVQS